MIYGLEGALISVCLFFSYVFICFRRLFEWYTALNTWENDRFLILREMFEAARTITGLPDHTFDLVTGGNIAYRGTTLNYETLKEMVIHIMEQDAVRRVVNVELKRSVNRLAAWETENPKPKRPLVLGHRIPIG
jgi:hypothetical protein